eukprot:TRINITY_DN4365_c1_g1_i1.p1 TRINITY_DN4365_c1_g1~~TRINITY_DN4365_c1_g1_i1.p1  ORF type:complete len:774 (+),score=314.48 TRINITY_DN4365_c1_g1_i1:84-2324(+)
MARGGRRLGWVAGRLACLAAVCLLCPQPASALREDCSRLSEVACGTDWECEMSGDNCTALHEEEACRAINTRADRSSLCESAWVCTWVPAIESCILNRTALCDDSNKATPLSCAQDRFCQFTATGCAPAKGVTKCEEFSHSIKECITYTDCRWRRGACVVEGEGECKEEEVEDHLGLYLVTVLITLAFLGVRVVQKLNMSALSESGGVIITGFVIGSIVFLLQQVVNRDILELIQFDEDAFTLFILPPIIFEAGFTLEHSGVMRNLGTILLYAVVGTLISSMTIGGLVYFASDLTFPELYHHPGAPFISLAFGALLSAVDPVAVIAVLGQQFDLTKPPLLYNLVFGEAVLNDAVSIVLYNVMVNFVEVEMTPTALAMAVVEFLKISSLSCIIGYFYGAMCALLLKHVNFKHHPSIEIILIGTFGIGSYYLAEVMHLSGIMSLFLCARIQGHHAMFNLSQEAREAAIFVFKTLAHLAETYVFVLLGQAFWGSHHSWRPLFMVVVYGIMLLGRALNIFPLSFLANLNRKRQKVSGAMQFFMWFSGLRGAIAFGLSLLTLSKAMNYKGDSPDKVITVEIAEVFVSTTLVMVVITVLVMGGFTEFLLNYLALTEAGNTNKPPARLLSEDKELALLAEGEDGMTAEVLYEEHPEGERDAYEGKKSKAFMRRVAKFDETHIGPLLRAEIFHVSHVHPHEAGMQAPVPVVHGAVPLADAPLGAGESEAQRVEYTPPASPVLTDSGMIVSQTAE